MKYFTAITGLLLLVTITVAAILQNPIALITVGALSSTVFIIVGASIVIIYQKLANDAEQKRFIQNERENMRLIQETQKAQNLMIRGMSSSLNLSSAPAHSDFLIEDTLFTELD